MKTLYFQCNMGAAGDMLTAALLELHPQPQEFLKRLNSLGLPHVVTTAEPAVKCGITGTHVTVKIHGHEEGEEHHHHEHDHEHHHEHEHHHDHEHHHEHEHHHDHKHHHDHEHSHPHTHAGLGDVEHIVSHMELPDQVRRDVLSVYELIAQAESKAHGVPVSEIHFHEVGTMDAIADVAAVCLLIHELKPDEILASPVHVGAGHVHCAHGILPVPAPATAHILQGVPTYGGEIQGELCTPTGAALLKHFVTRFGAQPVMRVEKIGYGMGKKDFPAANCVRAMLGETQGGRDRIVELACNLDDMTPEALGFATGLLMEKGALDVYVTPVQMKKNRPGAVLSCMCREEDREAMLSLLFAHTTTLGVRETVCNRYTLERSFRTLETPYGSVEMKTSTGWGVTREKPEYEDIARIARAQSLPLSQVEALVKSLSQKE